MGDPRPVEDHRVAVRDAARPLTPLRVPLLEAVGRRVVEDVVAPRDLPAFDHSAMDGFAVRADEVATASSQAPTALPVSALVPAGTPGGTLAPGAAVRIMTGAPLPEGADAVVPFELTDRGDDVVAVRAGVAAGEHVRRRGEDVEAGAVVVRAGEVLRPARVGLLAAVGVREVMVRPLPRVALVVTGAELLGDAGEAGVVESNSTLLAATVGSGSAGTVASVEVVGDEPAAFRAALERAVAAADLVVTTGGISVGDRDVVRGTLQAEPDFWFGPVAMKPGRPQGHGVVHTPDGREVPVVTLPGTPVAAYCSFLLFVREALAALAGEAPARSSLRAARDLELGARTVLLPGVVDDAGAVTPVPGHVGHAQSLLAQAEVLIVVPPGEGSLPAGGDVEVLWCEEATR